jgi:hypothetical protein
MLELSFSLCPSLFELERLDEGEKPEEKPNHIPCPPRCKWKVRKCNCKKASQQLQILELYFGDGLGFFFLDEIFTN